ncbi:MAG: DUF1566 domain-containing protein [Magnetococcus sp. WYHC-3]
MNGKNAGIAIVMLTAAWGSLGSASVQGGPLPRTGQVVPYATGDDGSHQKGVIWPSGVRFNDNGDGTVSDRLTGMIWLKNANCFGAHTWDAALIEVNALASGACGLNDGSAVGSWRLPNIIELESLVDAGAYNPALPTGHPFSGVASAEYWSSTTGPTLTTAGWNMSLFNGSVMGNMDKYNSCYVWPVRGGQ